jgi:hypothetical protein
LSGINKPVSSNDMALGQNSFILSYVVNEVLCHSLYQDIQSPEMSGIINTRLKTTGGHGKTRLISLNISKGRVDMILCS